MVSRLFNSTIKSKVYNQKSGISKLTSRMFSNPSKCQTGARVLTFISQLYTNSVCKTIVSFVTVLALLKKTSEMKLYITLI